MNPSPGLTAALQIIRETVNGTRRPNESLAEFRARVDRIHATCIGMHSGTGDPRL